MIYMPPIPAYLSAQFMPILFACLCFGYFGCLVPATAFQPWWALAGGRERQTTSAFSILCQVVVRFRAWFPGVHDVHEDTRQSGSIYKAQSFPKGFQNVRGVVHIAAQFSVFPASLCFRVDMNLCLFFLLIPSAMFYLFIYLSDCIGQLLFQLGRIFIVVHAVSQWGLEGLQILFSKESALEKAFNF